MKTFEDMKLLSMTDFVLEQRKVLNKYVNHDKGVLFERCEKYANFLKQLLELWMFVPCKLVDGVWVVLEEPKEDSLSGSFFDMQTGFHYEKEYQQAKERCLLNGFSEKDAKIALFANETIEDLIEFNLTLTQIAIKQIGL